MVRTKVSRMATKRGQNGSDSKLFIEMKLRDFEVISDCHLTKIELSYQQNMDTLTREFETLLGRIPKTLLSMTMGELRAMQKQPLTDPVNTSPRLNQTVSANMSALLEKSCRKKSKDDGYLTEESEHGDAYRVSALLATTKGSRLGPLMSAQARRRSKSACTLATPFAGRTMFTVQSASVSKIQPPASIYKQLPPASERTSRAKQRVLASQRPKAASADRGYGVITPKVQPSTPLAMIRHARLGEAVFAATGSPVITANMVEATANVNIPVANGMLSIRPTELDEIDPTMLEQIDPNVLLELKQLQCNLDKIMSSLKL